MQTPTVRIYVTANFVLFFVLCLYLLPEDVLFCFVALFYSFLFSSPVLLVLAGCFSFINLLKPGVAYSWLLLLLSVGCCATLPLMLSSLLEDSLLSNSAFLLLCLGSAFGGTLLQYSSINRYFKTIHHEPEQIENN